MPIWVGVQIDLAKFSVIGGRRGSQEMTRGNLEMTVRSIQNLRVATMASLVAMSLSQAAVAQTYRESTGSGLSSIVSCDAKGGKQGTGAIVGALLGAAAGSNLAKHDRGTGTAVGAAIGAATGSYVGCKMQRDAQEKSITNANANANDSLQPAVYSHEGYRLSGDIAPASFVGTSQQYVAKTTLNLRGAPTKAGTRVGQLQPGERFQALARVRGTDWVLVGQNGVGVGYVSGRYAQPVGYQTVAYRQ